MTETKKILINEILEWRHLLMLLEQIFAGYLSSPCTDDEILSGFIRQRTFINEKINARLEVLFCEEGDYCFEYIAYELQLDSILTSFDIKRSQT